LQQSRRDAANRVFSSRSPSIRRTLVQARQLLDSIDVSTIVGLRDRALIALLVYNGAMARPSALGYLFSATCCFLSFLSTG
jgi:hypothetical protein